MNLPIDFEEKVKRPAAVNGRSYPYQISARDLMQNFRYSALQVDDNEVSGLRLAATIEPGTGTRQVYLTGEIDISSVIQYPFQIYFNRDTNKWIIRNGICAGIYIGASQFDPPDGFSTVWVKITRNTSSRIVTAVQIEFNSGEIPDSNNQYQYVKIAEVYRDNSVLTQHRFEDIRLTEFLISDAGELKLVSVFDTTNTYALP
jgi:hypothetical protein